METVARAFFLPITEIKKELSLALNDEDLRWNYIAKYLLSFVLLPGFNGLYFRTQPKELKDFYKIISILVEQGVLTKENFDVFSQEEKKINTLEVPTTKGETLLLNRFNCEFEEFYYKISNSDLKRVISFYADTPSESYHSSEYYSLIDDVMEDIIVDKNIDIFELILSLMHPSDLAWYAYSVIDAVTKSNNKEFLIHLLRGNEDRFPEICEYLVDFDNSDLYKTLFDVLINGLCIKPEDILATINSASYNNCGYIYDALYKSVLETLSSIPEKERTLELVDFLTLWK